jgi:aspartate dehydrogenase
VLWLQYQAESTMLRKKVGIIGFGYIASFIYREISTRPELGLDVAFVWNRTPGRLEGVPSALILEDLAAFASRSADLIVEMSHPDISKDYAKDILAVTNYMMLSVTAMADAQLSNTLVQTAQACGTSLFVPHGALVGLDSLYEARENWADVTITFRKSPASMDFSASGIDPQTIQGETTVYDGSVRGAAEKFPRNVNTMATCALAGLGFDQTRGVVVLDPGATAMSAQVIAHGKDGSLLETKKEEQAVGVSGAGMLLSQLGSIRRAAFGAAAGLSFV